MASSGSAPTGPSEAYLQLLKGQLAPSEYVKAVKKRVDEQRQSASSKRSSNGTARGSSA